MTTILYLITKGNFGGAQRYVFDLTTNLPKTYKPIIVSGEGEELHTQAQKKGIETKTLPSLGRDISLFDMRAFSEVYTQIKETEPDVLHLNSSKIGLLGVCAGRLYNLTHKHKTKIIFTAHAWAFNDARYSPFMRLIFKTLQWFTVLMSHNTIAVSHAIKKEIASLPFISNKITVIQHGIKPFGRFDRVEARKLLCPNTNFTTWIGTISELTPNKGVDTAIEAFARIAHDYPDTAFVVMGEGDQRDELEELISYLELENRVFLCGFIHQAPEYLDALDIFTLTSRTEALGYVLLEAGLAEKPVIASRVGGIPEIIENTVTGILVRPNNIREIESALRFMLDHPEERSQMKKALKASVESTFSFQRMLDETLSLY